MNNSTNATRGERNNNPGNIRKSAVPWQGEIAGSDTQFCTFITPEKGIRAIAVLLRHYVREGFNTTAKIISHYAPNTENNTDAYIAAVCEGCDVQPDTPVDIANWNMLHAFVAAIIKHENGRCIYSDVIINKAVLSSAIIV